MEWWCKWKPYIIILKRHWKILEIPVREGAEQRSRHNSQKKPSPGIGCPGGAGECTCGKVSSTDDARKRGNETGKLLWINLVSQADVTGVESPLWKGTLICKHFSQTSRSWTVILRKQNNFSKKIWKTDLLRNAILISLWWKIFTLIWKRKPHEEPS